MAVGYSPKIITNGLVLCLDAANRKSYNGGNIWRDLSGNNNHATLTNGPIFNSANSGSIIFDGINDHCVNSAVPVNFDFNSTNAISAEAWINYTPNNYDFWFASSNVEIRYRFGTDPNGYFYWNVGRHTDRTYTSYILPSNSWNHIVFTAGLESGAIITRIYVNSNLIYSLNEGTNILAAGTDFFVGCGEAGNLHNFNGRIAMLKIYKLALSPREIFQNYNATKGRFNI